MEHKFNFVGHSNMSPLNVETMLVRSLGQMKFVSIGTIPMV